MDFNNLFNDMLSAFQEPLITEGEKVISYSQEILNSRKIKLEQLTLLRLSEDLTEEEFQSELEDEKKVLETQMLTVLIIGKSTAQKAINGAIDVLLSAIGKLI